jgi:hypothetical protein
MINVSCAVACPIGKLILPDLGNAAVARIPSPCISHPLFSVSAGANAKGDPGDDRTGGSKWTIEACGNFKSNSPTPGTLFIGLTLRFSKRGATLSAARSVYALCRRPVGATWKVAVKSYRVIIRDRQTQIVVGYYDGSWTTDRRRALALRKREVAEAHAARMRERCPRNADLIKVEELEAAD